MRFYSGFGFWNEKKLFENYLEEGEFVVAGFSYGAQKALIDAVHTNKRVDKLQLLSPAFFPKNPKFAKLQINTFKKDKENYIKNFLENVKYPKEIDLDIYLDETELYQLEEMFEFNWGLIEYAKQKNINIEVYIGEKDKIIDIKNAVKFFKNYAKVYFIKDVGHLL
jgi:pimeloyl-ACP methyl ester carboxylesterase